MAKKTNHKKRSKRLLALAFLLISASLFAHFRLRPVVKSISMSRAKIISANAVNEAILEELSENKELYGEMVKAEKLASGELTAIFSDMQKINKLKAKVALAIQNKFSEFKEKKIKIPLGTLTGSEMLGGIGPGVPMKISVTGNVSTEFKTCFKDAGINQTIYQIYLYIKTRISVVVPGCSCSEDFETNALVSEVVVLGSVPRVYSSQGGLGINSGE